MSRVEENEIMCTRVGSAKVGADIAPLCAVLMDISKSLAVLADCDTEIWRAETEPPMDPAIFRKKDEDDDV